MANLNRVCITGNLTRDPELRTTQTGTSVASLRVAVNDRVKRQGEWTDVAYFFDVTVWGASGEACARYLDKGSPIAVDGKLTWREWEAKDGSTRQSVEVVADSVQFLGRPRDDDEPRSRSDVPADPEPDFAASAATQGDTDDIPF